MIGIYKYINKINHKCYIGQSLNIEKRQYGHKSSAYNEKASDYNSQFHQAIRKYGLENFDFEVLVEIPSEEYSKDLLNQLEKFFIEKYDSYHNGYNATPGGDGGIAQKGSSNGRALLTEEDVNYIRECYNAHIPFRQVYEEYKDKISKRGLQKVWWFETWKDIHPEYNTEENKYWHSHQAKALDSETASKNAKKGRHISEDIVKEVRAAYENGMSVTDIWHTYLPWVKSNTTIYDILEGQSYKDV